MADTDLRGLNRALLGYVAGRAVSRLDGVLPVEQRVVAQRVAEMTDEEVERHLSAWPR